MPNAQQGRGLPAAPSQEIEEKRRAERAASGAQASTQGSEPEEWLEEELDWCVARFPAERAPAVAPMSCIHSDFSSSVDLGYWATPLDKLGECADEVAWHTRQPEESGGGLPAAAWSSSPLVAAGLILRMKPLRSSGNDTHLTVRSQGEDGIGQSSALE